MIVCRIRLTKQTHDGYALINAETNAHHFECGRTLVGIVVDWSDAEAQGLHEAVGEKLGNQLLKGCRYIGKSS